MKKTLPFSAIMMALTSIALWGINFPVTKLAMQNCPPVLLMAVRLGLAGFVLIFFAKFPATRAEFAKVLKLSVTQYGINFALCALGLQRSGAGIASIITLTDVPFSIILAFLILGERPSKRAVLGTAIALAGAIVVSYPGNMQSSIVGCVMLLGASFAYAFSSIQAKQIRLDAFSTMAWASLMAAPQLFLTSYLVEPHAWNQLENICTPTQTIYIVYLVGSSSVAFTLWIHLLRSYNIAQIMPLVLLLPVLAVAGGVFCLGESLTPAAMGGSAVILAGIAVIIFRRSEFLTLSRTSEGAGLRPEPDRGF